MIGKSRQIKDPAIKIKAAFLLMFGTASLLIWLYAPLEQYLDPQAIRDFLSGHALAAPLIFILIYGFGITMFLPASLFTALGAVLFGLSWGLLCNFAGAMLGAAMSFWIGRYLGRDFAAASIGDRLKSYDDKLAAHGFATILYLRLVFFPFTPLNFGLGLTGVTFGQFFWGTLFGKIASGVILTFFFASLAQAWTSGHWQGLLGWQTALSLVLFLASFCIPPLARRMFPTLAVVR